MANVEIDEAELAHLRNAAQFIARAEKLPEGRKMINKLAKGINPEIRTEEDIASEYAAPLKAELDDLKKWKGDMENRITSYNADESWSKVRAERQYTEDGIKQLRKFADENGIKNPAHAAAAWERENPATPMKPSYMSDSFTMQEMTGQEKAEQLKEITKNPGRFEDEQVAAFFAEKRGNVSFSKQ